MLLALQATRLLDKKLPKATRFFRTLLCLSLSKEETNSFPNSCEPRKSWYCDHSNTSFFFLYILFHLPFSILSVTICHFFFVFPFWIPCIGLLISHGFVFLLFPLFSLSFYFFFFFFFVRGAHRFFVLRWPSLGVVFTEFCCCCCCCFTEFFCRPDDPIQWLYPVLPSFSAW